MIAWRFSARRSLDTLVGLLGILKAGACYVPVDTRPIPLSA